MKVKKIKLMRVKPKVNSTHKIINLHNFTVPIKIIFETFDEPAIRAHIIVRKKVYASR